VKGLADKWIRPLNGNSLPDRALIGGKAWSIARMISLGLPVPPAFVITTKACGAYLATGDLPDGLVEEVSAAMRYLEQETGRHFGSADKPLLVSVRSGAAISMPGMMDTILNLSVDDRTEAALAAESGDASFARNTHRRFYELYSVIVMKAGGVQFSDEETTEGMERKTEKGNRQQDARDLRGAAIRCYPRRL